MDDEVVPQRSAHAQKKYSMREHTVTVYRCRICGVDFPCSSSLLMHMMTHNSASRYECGLCRKRFKSGGVLKAHMLVHTEERDYACFICDAQFKRRYSLQRHMSVHDRDNDNSTHNNISEKDTNVASKIETSENCNETNGTSKKLDKTNEIPKKRDETKDTLKTIKTYTKHKSTQNTKETFIRNESRNVINSDRKRSEKNGTYKAIKKVDTHYTKEKICAPKLTRNIGLLKLTKDVSTLRATKDVSTLRATRDVSTLKSSRNISVLTASKKPIVIKSYARITRQTDEKLIIASKSVSVNVHKVEIGRTSKRLSPTQKPDIQNRMSTRSTGEKTDTNGIVKRMSSQKACVKVSREQENIVKMDTSVCEKKEKLDTPSRKTIENIYECKICRTKLTQNSSLNVHANLHTIVIHMMSHTKPPFT